MGTGWLLSMLEKLFRDNKEDPVKFQIDLLNICNDYIELKKFEESFRDNKEDPLKFQIEQPLIE